MSGIYIHIPYCKKACIYCDFHFSTVLKSKELFLKALEVEILKAKDFFNLNKIETIYFGGGTPSLLSYDEMMRIFECLDVHFDFSTVQEITLEANPDDLNKKKIAEISQTPINRISIGVQSFKSEHLQWMNRSHTEQQIHQSLHDLRNNDFHNISIDLIYGFPLLSSDDWLYNLDQACNIYQIPHISAYYLTPEPKTLLYNQIVKKTFEIDENQGIIHYNELILFLKNKQYQHYETSNFCLEGYRSKHNSSYWENKPYIGFGPSAHSYVSPTRYFNVSNNALYIKSLLEIGVVPRKTEVLEEYEQFNDYIITHLRTQKGLNKKEFIRVFKEKYWNYVLNYIHANKQFHSMLNYSDDFIQLIEDSLIYQDSILRELVLIKNLS